MHRIVVGVDAGQARGPQVAPPARDPRPPLAVALGNRAFATLVARQRVTDRAAASPKLDYARAKRGNLRYAKPTSIGASSALGWEDKLSSHPRTAALAALWKAGDHDAFADAVAALQTGLGHRGKQVDGVLGPGTWARLTGLGEAMAGIDALTFKHSEELCYKASEERLKRGHQRATGKALELPEGATKSDFETIIAVHAHRMLDVDEAYRGAGAAGALVYAGLGTFVPEDEIWEGALAPGAALQVWRKRSSFELLRKGTITVKGKTRRLTEKDADFYGTSYVFVRYDTDTNERLLVRHFGRLEWVSKRDWAVWVAANPSAP
jgi:hypothetical protein